MRAITRYAAIVALAWLCLLLAVACAGLWADASCWRDRATTFHERWMNAAKAHQ